MNTSQTEASQATFMPDNPPPPQALAVIWETMCNYDKSACCHSHTQERGLNSDPCETEMSTGQPA